MLRATDRGATAVASMKLYLIFVIEFARQSNADLLPPPAMTHQGAGDLFAAHPFMTREYLAPRTRKNIHRVFDPTV